jgi:hypothetical protein
MAGPSTVTLCCCVDRYGCSMFESPKHIAQKSQTREASHTTQPQPPQCHHPINSRRIPKRTVLFSPCDSQIVHEHHRVWYACIGAAQRAICVTSACFASARLVVNTKLRATQCANNQPKSTIYPHQELYKTDSKRGCSLLLSWECQRAAAAGA